MAAARDNYADEVEAMASFELELEPTKDIYSDNQPEFRLAIQVIGSFQGNITVNYDDMELMKIVGGDIAPSKAISADSRVQRVYGSVQRTFFYETQTFNYADVAASFQSLTLSVTDRILPDGIRPTPVYLVRSCITDMEADAVKKTYIVIFIQL